MTRGRELVPVTAIIGTVSVPRLVGRVKFSFVGFHSFLGFVTDLRFASANEVRSPRTDSDQNQNSPSVKCNKELQKTQREDLRHQSRFRSRLHVASPGRSLAIEVDRLIGLLHYDRGGTPVRDTDDQVRWQSASEHGSCGEKGVLGGQVGRGAEGKNRWTFARCDEPVLSGRDNKKDRSHEGTFPGGSPGARASIVTTRDGTVCLI